MPFGKVSTYLLYSGNYLRFREKNMKKIKKHLHFLKYCNIIYFVGRAHAKHKNAPLAQLVEHLTLNQGVQGSSPWRCIWKD